MEQTKSIYFLTFLSVYVSGAFALTCLRCDGISQPRHCRQVVQCAGSEQCYTERTLNSFGEYVYNMGCLRTTECSRQSHGATVSCAECCSSDLCNAAGCGQPDYPAVRGPICYNCPMYLDLSRCHQIDFCSEGEVCRLSGLHEFSELVYSSGCSTEEECDSSFVDPGVVVGRRDTSLHRRSNKPVCGSCCADDLCNTNCKATSPPTTSYPTTAYPTTYTTGTAYTTGPVVLLSSTESTSEIPTTPMESTSTTSHIRDWQDCQEILDAGYSTGDGLYTIYYYGVHEDVFCDMTTDGGGWTVFQYRYDGSVDFYRNFTEYEDGFGFYPGEYWQGLKWLNYITNRKNYTLRVDLTAPNGTRGYAEYQYFTIDPSEKYTIHFKGYSGNIGDKLDRQLNQAFSTFDHDQDGYTSSTNCALDYHGAWWYETCFDSNLNARYDPGSSDHSSMAWAYWPDEDSFYLGLKGSRMSIRPM